MKKLAISLFALCIYNCVCAQSCLPKGITFNTQAQIDSFQIKYPGCTEIEGDVTILEWKNILNLDSLSVLRSIKGNLLIESTPSLTSLNGLNNLVSIGGDLKIVWQSALTSLTGLENLKSIGGGFSIYGNSSIKYLSGLENVTSIGGSLSIFQSAVASLTGLKNLNSVGGYFYISASPLTSLEGLENLKSIGGFVYIDYNNELESLSALNKLNSIVGKIRIFGNPLLNSLSGLENVRAATITELTITDNKTLSSCDALNICNYLASPGGVINIYSNAPGCNSPNEVASSCLIELSCLPFGNYNFNTQSDVDNFPKNFPNCTELKGDVFIGGNITNLDSLAKITSVSGSLAINSSTLVNLNGLGNLTYVGGTLGILSNSLTDLTGLEKLNFIGGNLLINRQFLLTSVNGLNNLKTIGGDLIIIGTGLTNLAGLNNLTAIGGNLQLGPRSDSGWFPENPPPGNSALTNLSGLENLTSIGGDVEIDRNSVLTSLTGINNVKSIGGNLYIWDNPVLSSCEVQSICDYLGSPNGNVEINNNAPGCNNSEEVRAACMGVGLESISSDNTCTIYPNPATNKISIEPSSNQQGETILCIFNMNGALLQQEKFQNQNPIELDVSALAKGFYLVKIQTNKGIETKKLVVQ